MKHGLQTIVSWGLLGASKVLSSSAFASGYDAAVMRDRPALYLKLSAAQGNSTERDLAGGNDATYLPNANTVRKTLMPNGDWATVFDGRTQYLEIPSAEEVSVRAGGAITIEAWLRPDTLEFPRTESDGYVNWAGKGAPGEHEYALRMYSYTNSANRPNRISGYAFNLNGGLGSGSYFQDPVVAGQWIHVAVVIDARPTETAPAGSVLIYKNGKLRKSTPLSQFNVEPEPGDAPLRIGTRDFASFFKGAIGKFAIYPRALSASKLTAHYLKMR